MKIKIDLAAFEALTQEQVEALAEAQAGERQRDVSLDPKTDCIFWGEWMTGLAVRVDYVEVSFEGDSSYIRWATIEKMAEYNVITFQP